MPSEWLRRSNTQHSRGEWRIWHMLVVERLILVLVSLKWPPTEQYLLGHCRAQEASKQMWTPVVPTSQGICFWTRFILRYNMQVAWNYAGRMVEAETLDCFDSQKNLLLTSPKKLLRHESDMLRFLLCCEPNLLQQGRFCGFMWPRWFQKKMGNVSVRLRVWKRAARTTITSWILHRCHATGFAI